MAKSDMIELEGTVVEALPNTTFRVDIGNDPCAKSARSSSARAKLWSFAKTRSISRDKVNKEALKKYGKNFRR